MNILLNGYKGRMGTALTECADEAGARIIARTDMGDSLTEDIADVEVVIDFSHPQATLPMLEILRENKIPVVIGTTGHSQQQLDQIREFGRFLPIVHAGNYSVGVATLLFLAEKAASLLGPDYNPEIVEIHHRHKKDAPSGTALNLLDALRSVTEFADHAPIDGRSGQCGARPENEIGMHALRGGEVVGEHTLYFLGAHDRIELTHRASDRRIFAMGAYRAASWVRNQPPGLYTMRTVLGLEQN